MAIKIIACIVAVIVIVGAFMGAQTGDLDFWLTFGIAMALVFGPLIAMDAKKMTKREAAESESAPTDES